MRRQYPLELWLYCNQALAGSPRYNIRASLSSQTECGQFAEELVRAKGRNRVTFGPHFSFTFGQNRETDRLFALFYYHIASIEGDLPERFCDVVQRVLFNPEEDWNPAKKVL
jgi:hypothetical protein